MNNEEMGDIPTHYNIVDFPTEWDIQAKCADDINYREKAEYLWQILDDIDTASDMFKPCDEKSYKAFYDYAMRRCEERGKHLCSLDGYTLQAPEVIKYEQEVQKRYDKWNEFNKKRGKEYDDHVNAHKETLSEKECSDYLFKWHQLVDQEINMWIRINKLVDQEEYDFICNWRGFDEDMKEYIDSVLDYVGLKGY